MCQIKATENKTQNIRDAFRFAKSAKELGTDVIVFGEYFTNVNVSKLFRSFAEPVSEHQEHELAKLVNSTIGQKASLGLDTFIERILESPIPGYLFLKALSYELGVLVVGGSLVEAVGDKLFNTCFVFDKGELLGLHRKIHLFDIDVPGRMTFKESETMSPGTTPTLIKTRFGNFGFGICYDIRFASYAMLLRQMGAEVLFYPSIFNNETGPRHFLLSGQARALDTQCFVILSSCAQYKERPDFYQSFGHSAIIDCDGKIRQHLGRDEGILMGEVDLSLVEEIRTQIPYTSEGQTRPDIYGFKNVPK